MGSMEELRYLISCVQREGQKKHTELLKSLKLTQNQAEVIQVLGKREPLSLKELGELLICESTSPSRLVQRLVHNGFIYKSKAIDDNRKSVLHLTSKGREILPELREREREFDEYLEKRLPKTLSIKDMISIFSIQIQGTQSAEKMKNRQEDFYSK